MDLNVQLNDIMYSYDHDKHYILGELKKMSKSQMAQYCVRAVNFGYLEVVRILVDLGADLNAISDEYHVTSIFKAIEMGHLEVAKYLFEHGARIDFTNAHGETPLHIACDGYQEAAVKWLISKGADVHAKTEIEETPAFRVYQGDYSAVASSTILHILLEAGADVLVKNQIGYSLLHQICYAGDYYAALEVLKRGADVGSCTDEGRTPLHFAAESGRIEVTKLLIQHGANVNALDFEGKTPLKYAELNSHEDLAEFLRQKGAGA